MPLLSDVPTEVIRYILSFVPKSDLVTLCRTTRPLQYHAERIIYSTITLKWTNNYKPPIIPLLSTLLYKPKRFAYVDHFSLLGHEWNRSEPSRLALDIPSTPLNQFISAVKETQVSYTDLWVDKLRSGSMDAIAGLLIAHISMTRTLTVKFNFIDDFDLVSKVIQSKASSDQLTRFERIKKLAYVNRVDHYQNQDEIFKEVISAFYLPTVTEITAWVPNPTIFQWPLGEPNLNHLTSLDIEWLCPQFLAKILTLTRNLISLRWSWDYIDTGESHKTTTLDFDEIIAALSPVKDTLQRLRIDFRVGFGQAEDWPDMNISGSFSGLVNFHKITELHIPFVALAGFGPEITPLECHVPSSVRILSLSIDMLDDGELYWAEDPDKDDLDQVITTMVQSLAENCPRRLPQLYQIRLFVDTRNFLYMDIEEMLDKLSLGVDVQVLDYDRSWFERYMGP